jgi:DNA repair exonuclease SbcCD ATPase subunit
MTIKVVYPDGEAYIEELSGGERCCASLSFLVAVNRQFAGRVGFLVLDEPTYGLDADHINTLAKLFLEIQKYATSTGLQIIVVTHEERLKLGFSNIISV